MSTKRILAFTGIRSDYDLLSGLYKAIQQDESLTLGIVVSGAHLSDTYGRTVTHIEKDGLPIIERIESLLDSNSPSSRVKSAAILLQCCLQTVARFSPDLILFAGDREDAMAAALAGAYIGIPTIHFFGGDHTTDGNVDNPVRHAISKLSSLHFTIHDDHKRRLMAMGEPENRIFVIGNPAIDAFVSTPILSREDVLAQMSRPDWSEYCIAIYHPILGQEQMAYKGFVNILDALHAAGVKAFIGYPNSDAGNRDILRVIHEKRENQNFCFFGNIPRGLFINLLRYSMFLIGNSSAGIVEAPSIPLGVVNVGPRQKGRLSAGNVIFVEQNVLDISSGIEKVLSEEFKTNLGNISSIYGDGDSIGTALHLIKTLDYSTYLRKTEDPLG
jgi:UDP-hydrolysing UDP-N-acetyl-D-glucosamine 2-epimerase